MHNNKSLGILTRSTWNGEAQITHSNTIRGSSLKNNIEYFGLVGGGKRAQAVKVEPTNLFKRISTKNKLPTIGSFIGCATIEDVSNLKPTTTFLE